MATPSHKNDQPQGFNKELPNSFDAERALLGSILINPDVPNPLLQQAVQHISSGDFFRVQHSLVFQAMIAMQEKRQAMDLVILNDSLERSGTLERAGGSAYLASLIDGVPRTPLIDHYAKIIREKSELRKGIYFAQSCQQRIADGELTADQLALEIDAFRKGQFNPFTKTLTKVSVGEFATMELPPLEYIIEPLLTQRGRGMIYSPRGSGKTFITMQLAYAVAGGLPNYFNWPVAKARPVVYVDGEMHAAMLQERVRQIIRMNGPDTIPNAGYLQFITRDLQKDVRPKVNTVDGRLQIERHLMPGDLLILDNISSLSPSSDEKETEDWAQIEDWFSEMCWHGITVIFVHHAGKGGDQRGTSKREDLLDFVLKMRVPSDYSMEEGLRAELHLTKMRGNPVKGIYGQPFEVKIDRDADGRMIWVTRQLKDILRERARQMLADGMKTNDVAQETGLSRWSVARISRGLKFGHSSE